MRYPGWLKDKLLPSIQTDADVLVLAGDIVCLSHREWRNAMECLRLLAAAYPAVVMVCGNHEFYHGSIRAGTRELLKMEGQIPGLRVLTPGTATSLWGQRFLGGTLWQPHGRNTDRYPSISDHHLIEDFHKEAPRQYRALKKFLEQEIRPNDVVVTHHAPSNLSIAPQWEGHPCNRWFITPEMEPVISKLQPKLWIHGHTHTPMDYRIGRTRVVCNPAGYYGEEVPFNPTLTIDL
jgi:predicted phosphodiesterase